MWWNKISKLYRRINQHHTTHNVPHRWPLSRERGQSLVEFAIILPLLLVLTLGTIDIGMGFKTYIALTNASREGVRSITIYPSNQALAEARIRGEASAVGLSDAPLAERSYTVSFSPGGPYVAGTKVTVSVLHEYQLLFGIIPGISAIPFTASSTMVVLYNE